MLKQTRGINVSKYRQTFHVFVINLSSKSSFDHATAQSNQNTNQNNLAAAVTASSMMHCLPTSA